MSKPIVYIDGKEGTTGLQIYDRLAQRQDIDLLLIDEDKRKDAAERKKVHQRGGYCVFVPARRGGPGGCGLGGERPNPDH